MLLRRLYVKNNCFLLGYAFSRGSKEKMAKMLADNEELLSQYPILKSDFSKFDFF
jgi:hypothetical protein